MSKLQKFAMCCILCAKLTGKAHAATDGDIEFVKHEAIVETIIEFCSRYLVIDGPTLLRILKKSDDLLAKDHSLEEVWMVTTRDTRNSYKAEPAGFCKLKLQNVINNSRGFEHPFKSVAK